MCPENGLNNISRTRLSHKGCISMKLGTETYYIRKYESNTKVPPKDPLTSEEKEFLKTTLANKCLAAYVARMTSSGLQNDLDMIQDLHGESWAALDNILDKFDKSKCGKIEKYDVPGAKNPKSLEFYFYNYFCHRVNFMACDTRTEKRKRGMIGSKSFSTGEVIYNPEDKSINPESPHMFDTIKYLYKELLTQPQAIQDLFHEIYVEEFETEELKAKHPDYLKLRRTLGAFLKDFNEKYSNVIKEEVGSSVAKKRTRKTKGESV